MTVGILVQRFGAYIRDSYGSYELDAEVQAQADKAAEAFPAGLRDIRESIAHHLIPLVLLARCDNDYDHRERDVIVEHCVVVARQKGVELTDAHKAVFADYVSAFRPGLIQLDPALDRLARAPQQEIAGLLRAAHNVVLADGATRPEELRFFADLNRELEAALAPPRSI